MSNTQEAGFRERLWVLLLEAVSRDNVFPLTSACNMRCRFCSHRQNPPGVQAYTFAPLSWEWIKELIPFLDPSKKIIIGESSTRLCEGEPFTHPLFLEVLKNIRGAFPHTPLQITTNGAYLQDNNIREIAALNQPAEGAGVELVVSLNSASPAHRAGIMGDANPGVVPDGLARCRENGIGFHGSVVALPHLTGWDDLEQTLLYLDKAGALSTRVFLPGFTSYAQPALHFPPSLWEDLNLFLERIRGKVNHPLTLEPPVKKDLSARVEGILRASPAYIAGFMTGDVIISVNGKSVISGTDAFHRLQRNQDPIVELYRPVRKAPSVPESGKCRNNKEAIRQEVFTQRLTKKAGVPSGLVFNADLDPSLITAVSDAAESNAGKPVLFLTSTLAAPLWRDAQRCSLLPGIIQVSPVENRFFGGSICCAGLLTVDDLRVHLLEQLPRYENTSEYPLILVPPAPFDRKGYDLCGVHYQSLQKTFPRHQFKFFK